ncbi:hypothetical protein DFJ73DRAFT_96373 [Zopfochytrium polystomum]|nr:hypothetical protein DFJ73DRAFT_96373 [Zopfochytrium polystomum]
MDTSQYIANSNVMVALAVSLITILVSFWEVIAKISNPVLFWTLILSATGHLVYTLGSAVIARNVAADQDFDKYFYLTAWLTAADLIAWFSIVFHTSYRTLLIMYPFSKRIWIVPSIILAVQVGLQSTGTWFWYNNWTTNQFATATPQFYWLAIVIMVFVSTIDSLFFFMAQYKIITTLRDVSNTPVSALHVVRMILRSVCYSSAVVMEFVTLGQYFYPVGTAWPFVYQSQNLMIMVLLSDSHYVTQIVAYYSNSGRSTGMSAFKSGMLQSETGSNGGVGAGGTGGAGRSPDRLGM